MSFASRLKEQRLKMGLTQATLAEALGVTKSAIGNYETGLNSPKAETLFKVFEVLQCDANYLFQDEMAEYLPGSDHSGGGQCICHVPDAPVYDVDSRFPD